MGGDPDWQRATAACNVMWKVTWLMPHTDFIRDRITSFAVLSLQGVRFPGYEFNLPVIVNLSVYLMLKCMNLQNECKL